jgi:hypothetical protein
MVALAVEADEAFNLDSTHLIASVTDPFGNRFGVIENPHFNAADVR